MHREAVNKVFRKALAGVGKAQLYRALWILKHTGMKHAVALCGERVNRIWSNVP